MSRRDNLKRKATDAAELKAKRAKGETDLGDDLKWSMHGDLIKTFNPLIALTSSSLPGKTKVAGFDIDWTVIRTASGRKFATGARDWEWWDDCVPTKLKQLNKDGYRVLLFTNQAGIEKLKVQPDEVTQKIEAIVKELGIPVMAYICTGNNHFRKPSTGMWDFFEKNNNQGIKVNRAESVFVGDAAGRAKNWAPDKPKDFTCGDRMFGTNVGAKFYTPEEFFLKEKSVPFTWGAVDPIDLSTKTPKAPVKDYHSKSQEVVVMVGMPASGKSSFRKRYFEPHGYITVNRDTMGTMAKCLKAGKEALKNGESLVCDNTNPSASARKDFIQLAKDKGVPCRCVWMKTSREVSNHLNLVRQNQTNGEVRRIPGVGYNVFLKNFEPPTTKEGFSAIVEVDFALKFDDKRHEELFKQWTCPER